MQSKRFTKNDGGFTCINCGLEVVPLGHSSRNHCPRCLCSLHVDVNPGDRASECRGLMRPVSVRTDGRRGLVIVHRCEKCGELKRNMAAVGARVQPDDMEELIRLCAAGSPEPGACDTKGRKSRRRRGAAGA